jgi:hypothetical protein
MQVYKKSRKGSFLRLWLQSLQKRKSTPRKHKYRGRGKGGGQGGEMAQTMYAHMSKRIKKKKRRKYKYQPKVSQGMDSRAEPGSPSRAHISLWPVQAIKPCFC